MKKTLTDLKEFIKIQKIENNPYVRIGILISLNKLEIDRLQINGSENCIDLIDKIFKGLEKYEFVDLFRMIVSNVYFTLAKSIRPDNSFEKEKDYFNKVNFKYYHIDLDKLDTIYQIIEANRQENQVTKNTVNQLHTLITSKWEINALLHLLDS
ncbi:hypothetical protein [Leptospira sp. 'Mane']|uniref:hypothetical protein n=1 Tax=Leptospira sp. 'Mane' TaxID=3387407 RepID=UPI00398A953F